MFKNFGIRKFIAILFTIAFVLFAGVTMFTDKAIPEYFAVIATSVVSYYFGKSTALDNPNNK